MAELAVIMIAVLVIPERQTEIRDGGVTCCPDWMTVWDNWHTSKNDQRGTTVRYKY
jgi:hypothetical protein